VWRQTAPEVFRRKLMLQLIAQLEHWFNRADHIHEYTAHRPSVFQKPNLILSKGPKQVHTFILFTPYNGNIGSCVQKIRTLYNVHKRNHSWTQWPRGLRRRCPAERLLGSWVRIPPAAWMFVSCECLCCQVEVSATGWSLVQRSPTDCGACLSVTKWK
jgi:hypothetical protein